MPQVSIDDIYTTVVEAEERVSQVKEYLQWTRQPIQIMVNRETGEIQSGQAIFLAAKELGWESVDVMYTDALDWSDVELGRISVPLSRLSVFEFRRGQTSLIVVIAPSLELALKNLAEQLSSEVTSVDTDKLEIRLPKQVWRYKVNELRSGLTVTLKR